MKRLSIFAGVLLCAALALTVFTFFLPGKPAEAALAAQQTPQAAVDGETACDTTRTVQVTGSATVNALPDRALIQLGVQSNGRTPGVVQAENTAAMSRVIAAVKALGVEAKDIATDVYIIEPVYEDYNSLYIKGYRINNQVAITLRKVDMAGDVLAAALEAGANQVINVELYTSELRKYRDQARQEAMIAASEKAQALAQAVGSNSGCALNISENTWSYYNGWWSANNANLWAQNTIQNASQGNSASPNGEAEPVSLGQISVRAEVSVTFALK